jgi:hypothetical protein
MQLNRFGKLQLFAEATEGAQSAATPPTSAGNQTSGDEQTPKTYTEEQLQAEIRKAADATAAKVRRELEGKYKPQLEEASKALDAARPFIENPTGYMTAFLAQNPQALQAVAEGVDRMLKGGAPTNAQVQAVARAADEATDPKVAKKLEALETEMRATREAVEEQKQLDAEYKGFAKEAKAEGLDFDADTFTEFVNKYCDDNGIGDDDAVDTKLLFRLWKSEQKLASANTRKAPKLPGSSPVQTQAKPAPKSWADAEAAMEAALRGQRD